MMNWIPVTHHKRINLLDTDVQTGSRMGGTPPLNTPENLTCPACKGKTQYVLTLSEDVLSKELAKNKELSFFVCKDFDCCWSGQNIIEPSPLMYILHDPSERNPVGNDMNSPCD